MKHRSAEMTMSWSEIKVSLQIMDILTCFRFSPNAAAAAAAAAKSLQSCLTLCDPRDGSPPGSPIPGILQARTLEWVAIAWKVKCESEVAQWCPTLSDPMDWSLPGSSAHGILQARILYRVASLFSRGFSQPRDRTQVSHIAGRCFTIWTTREVQEYRSR